jgi:poly-gamma-glutamate synthesis protein (capsule biosynthesis protein)
VSTTVVALPADDSSLVRIALVGDVMLGRGIAATVASDPDELFASVRHLLAAADIAGANLESPLTSRPHSSTNENVVLASPASATVLAGAGFDVVSLPNNHAADAGPLGILDSIAAAEAVGMQTVGAGSDATAAKTPLEVPVGDLVVGFLAFDATGMSEAAGEGPGVMVWDDEVGPSLVAGLRATSDVVVVSIHGGSEYLVTNDPLMRDIAGSVVAAGADVVWGHGAHVMQPVYAVEEARRAVVATSLGNFIFDQSGPGRSTGAILEVLAGAAGVIAYRVAVTEHGDRRVRFVEWQQPVGDAVWLDGGWWTLIGSPRLADPGDVAVEPFRHGDLTAAAEGDVTGSGTRYVVASFRRPFVETDYARLRPDTQWVDDSGRSAHVGVYSRTNLDEVWVAGSVSMPVAGLAVCSGSISVTHDSLDDAAVTASGAWVWNGFGFATAPDLPGAGTPGCADVDLDGRTEPVIVDRVTASP